MSEKREQTAVGALLGLSLLLRAAFALYFYRHPSNLIGADFYLDVAANLVTRGEFAVVAGMPSIDMSPGFPLWVAGLYLVFGIQPLAVLLANCVLSAATGWVLWTTARRRFGPRPALLALAAWAIYPYAVYYCGWTMRESLLTFLAAALIALGDRWLERGGRGLAAAAGALAAALAHVNPSTLLFIASLPAARALLGRSRRAWAEAALFAAALALVYSPWVIRNQLVFGRPILTNVHGGMNLYHGLRIPAEDMGTIRETEFRRTDPVEVEGERLIKSGKPFEAAELYRRSANALIAADPWGYAKQSLGRVAKFWRLVPYRRGYPYGYAKIFWTSLLSDGLLIPLGALGLWLTLRRRRELWALYLPLLFIPLAYYLIYAVIRFRMPVMPVVIMFAAVPVDEMMRRMRRA